MDTVAEYLSHDREEFRRRIGAMEKTVDFSDARNGDFVTLMRADYGEELARGLSETCLRSEFMVEVVGLKRKRDDFEIDSGSLDVEDEPIVLGNYARSLAMESPFPGAPDCINLTHDSDSDDDDDCVIVGCVMPQSTLPGALVDYNIVLAHDSDSGDDDDCVIMGCWLPHAVVIWDSEAGDEFSDSESHDDELRASEADDDLSDSESADEFSDSDSESDDELNAPVWDVDDEVCWGWFD